MRRLTVPLAYFLLAAGTPAAVAATVAAMQRLAPFEIFFEEDSGRLTDEARVILDAMIGVYRSQGAGQPITIRGHTDDTLPAVRAMAMSRVRANRVRNYLVEKGLPPTAITTEGFGATRPYVLSPTGRPERLNRRVEITIGRSTAW